MTGVLIGNSGIAAAMALAMMDPGPAPRGIPIAEEMAMMPRDPGFHIPRRDRAKKKKFNPYGAKQKAQRGARKKNRR